MERERLRRPEICSRKKGGPLGQSPGHLSGSPLTNLSKELRSKSLTGEEVRLTGKELPGRGDTRERKTTSWLNSEWEVFKGKGGRNKTRYEVHASRKRNFLERRHE